MTKIDHFRTFALMAAAALATSLLMLIDCTNLQPLEDSLLRYATRSTAENSVLGDALGSAVH